MKICSIIFSFDSANLTKTTYEQLKANEGHDIFVLENSTTPEKMFISPDTIDLGRKNLGRGGVYDYVFTSPLFRKYDFIGVYNNDIYDIPTDYIAKLKPYFKPENGMISSAINKGGTGWKHMERVRGEGFREVEHVEDIAAFYNVNVFDELKKYSPYQYYGIVDIQITQIIKSLGYKTIVVDDLTISHMLSGARKEAGVFDEYLKQSSEKMTSWHERFPVVGRFYEEYIKSIDKPVAVIIPNYNHNHYLRAAIESVLQNKTAIDIVVVDDHSKEDPYELIKDLPIRYFRHDKNRGLAATRNTGIANTVAKFILPLDADDKLFPGKVDFLVGAMKDDIDIVYGNLVWMDNGSQLKPTPKIEKEMFYGNNQLFGTSLYRKSLWEKTGGYWEKPHTCYEDWDFWARCAYMGARFKYFDEDIYQYKGGQEGMCWQLGKEREKNCKLVIEHLKEYENSRIDNCV